MNGLSWACHIMSDVSWWKLYNKFSCTRSSSSCKIYVKKHILCQVSAIDQRSKETSKPKQGASMRGSQIGNFHSSDLGSGFLTAERADNAAVQVFTYLKVI